MIEAEITKPAKHGFVLDLVEGARRIQVRIFEFEEQALPPLMSDGRCEMPVTIMLNGSSVDNWVTAMRQIKDLLQDAQLWWATDGARGAPA